MNVLQTLAASAQTLRGRGVNHEGEHFTGELKVEPLVGGSAVLLRYRAVLDDGSVVHEESTLLARGPDGLLTLWPVMSELQVVLPHVEVAGVDRAHGAAGVRTVFASGARDDERSFREEITLEVAPGGQVTYAHAWGLPGGPFAERSSCRMAPVEV